MQDRGFQTQAYKKRNLYFTSLKKVFRQESELNHTTVLRCHNMNSMFCFVQNKPP